MGAVMRRLVELDEPALANMLVKQVSYQGPLHYTDSGHAFSAMQLSRHPWPAAEAACHTSYCLPAGRRNLLLSTTNASQSYQHVTPNIRVQLVMRAMDRRARECEAASVLLAALHPKLIDPQQVSSALRPIYVCCFPHLIETLLSAVARGLVCCWLSWHPAGSRPSAAKCSGLL